MKGVPKNPSGPKGAWYKLVNEKVQEAAGAETVAELLEILGPPDEAACGANVYSPSKFMADIGSILSFGDERAELVLTYVDPFRPRKRYRFGIVKDSVDSHWIETSSRSAS